MTVLIPIQEKDSSWRNRAACGEGSRYRLADLDRWLFPRSEREIRQRRWVKVCRSCPVKAECAAWGEASDSVGVYGGEYRGQKNPAKTCPEGHELVSGLDVCLICQARKEEDD